MIVLIGYFWAQYWLKVENNMASKSLKIGLNSNQTVFQFPIIFQYCLQANQQLLTRSKARQIQN